MHILETDLIRLFQLPQKAYTDASRLALAIVHRIDYLLTWNCAHLANALLQKELVEYRRSWWSIAATTTAMFRLSALLKHSFPDMNNPIIDEIRQARAALAAEHGYDLVRINEWARQQTAVRNQILLEQRANKALLETDGAAESSRDSKDLSSPHPRQS